MYTELDNREQGIYRNLIDECWVKGSITSDPQILARFVHEPVEYFAGIWVKLRPKFKKINNGDRLISPRLEEDRERLMRTAKFAEKRARKAAKIRWAKTNAEKGIDATSIAQASLKHAFKHSHSHSHNQISTEDNSLIGKGSGETSRKSRAPETLEITERMRLWAEENGVTVNLDAETAAMLDFHRGRGNLQLDWMATWRTWMRNSKRFNGAATVKREPKDDWAEVKAERERTFGKKT